MEEMERNEQMAVDDNMTPESSPVAEETKKNGKKWGIIIGIAAVVAVIAVAVGLMRPKKDPKTAVVDAFKSITSAEEVSPLEDIFGWEDMYEKMKTNPYQANMEVQMDDSSMEELSSLVSGRLFMDVKAIPETKEESLVLGIGYAGMDLATLQAYIDDTNFVMSLPEFSSKAFTLNYKDDLQGQIENSPFVGPMLKDAGMEMDGFTEYIQYIQDASYGESEPFDVKGLWQRYKEGSKAIDDLKAAMTVEEIESKKQTINGKEETVNGYQVTVTKDALTAFIESTKDFLLTDETFKKDFLDYIDQINNVNSMYGLDVNGQSIPGGEELWSMLTDTADDGLASFYEGLGDINATVYVRKDGKMASYEAKTPLTIKDETEGTDDVLNLTITGTYEGGYSLKANSSTSIEVENEGQAVSVSLIRAGSYDDKAYNSSYDIRLAADEMDVSLLLEGSYTLADGAYTMNASALSGGTEAAALKIQGVVSGLVKGESFDASVDSMNLKIEAGDQMLSMDLSGRYALMPLEGGVDMPEGDPMDVLAATEDDWNNVAMEMFAGAMGLMSQIQ